MLYYQKTFDGMLKLNLKFEIFWWVNKLMLSKCCSNVTKISC
eukprot:UN16219